MDSPWTLRPVHPADADQIALHGCHRPDDAARRPSYSAWVRSRLEAGRYLGWFAIDGDGAVVGGAGAVLLDWGPTRANPGGQLARVANVFTAESHRRQGIARTLLLSLIAQCEAGGIQEFNLAATADGQGLYRSLGFEAYPAEMRRRSPSAPALRP